MKKLLLLALSTITIFCAQPPNSPRLADRSSHPKRSLLNLCARVVHKSAHAGAACCICALTIGVAASDCSECRWLTDEVSDYENLLNVVHVLTAQACFHCKAACGLEKPECCTAMSRED
jgi:hypothetical protein